MQTTPKALYNSKRCLLLREDIRRTTSQTLIGEEAADLLYQAMVHVCPRMPTSEPWPQGLEDNREAVDG
jgi:hypothetical protein